MIDADHLRALALRARDDDREPVASVAVTPDAVPMHLALDPATVLELLNDARIERASFESACDAADEFDTRLEHVVEQWRNEAMAKRHHTTLLSLRGYADGLDACAEALENMLKERR